MSEKVQSRRRWRVTRRGFLIGLGATTATLAIGVAAGRPRLHEFMGETVDSGNGAFGSVTNTPSTWFEITADNRVRVFIPKVEMGTGIHTSISQIAADELEVSMAQLDVLQASSTHGFGQASQTGNSDAITLSYTPVREAAAAVRETLKQEAATQLGVSIGALSVADGEIWVTAVPENRLTYGEIVASVDL
ncbi:MAG: molybdopterin cofactor-binding domain-containing protein, partial [Chloroflexota bacterium]